MEETGLRSRFFVRGQEASSTLDEGCLANCERHGKRRVIRLPNAHFPVQFSMQLGMAG